MEGTITGEHGIGLSLRDMLVEEVGQSGVDFMRKVYLQDLGNDVCTVTDQAFL